MPDFSKRSLLPEKMDLPGIPDDELRQNLRELETVNKLLGGHHVIINALEKLEWKNEPVTIIDFGCGGGDMLREIASWAEKKNHIINLIGIDRNPVMIEYASEKSKNFSNISYKMMDVFDDTLMREKADITM